MDKIRQALDRARQERAALEEMLDAPREQPEPPRAPAESVVHVLPPNGAALSLPRALGAAEPEEAQARGKEFEPDRNALERHRVLEPGADGPAADAFRLLRSQVLDRMRARSWQTLGVVSAGDADGKTTLAANLAVTIAADPRHTALLVDLDLRRPAVADVFGIAAEVGVEEVLSGAASIEAALLHPTPFPRLRLLPARAAVDGSSTLVAGNVCGAFITELKGRYANRIVVFDLPPVLVADDAAIVAAHLDCVLFVVTEGRTPRADVARAMELLSHTKVLGTVLNASAALPRVRAEV